MLKFCEKVLWLTLKDKLETETRVENGAFYVCYLTNNLFTCKNSSHVLFNQKMPEKAVFIDNQTIYAYPRHLCPNYFQKAGVYCIGVLGPYKITLDTVTYITQSEYITLYSTNCSLVNCDCLLLIRVKLLTLKK